MSKFFRFFIEGIAWLQIVGSPLIIGLAIGALVYLSTPNTTGLIIGISIACIGLIIGVLWATKVWQTKGTVWFMSRVMASPDLDKTDEEIRNKET